MHDQPCLLPDGSVILIGGRTSPIRLCVQLLKLEFVRECNKKNENSGHNFKDNLDINDPSAYYESENNRHLVGSYHVNSKCTNSYTSSDIASNNLDERQVNKSNSITECNYDTEDMLHENSKVETDINNPDLQRHSSKYKSSVSELDKLDNKMENCTIPSDISGISGHVSSGECDELTTASTCDRSGKDAEEGRFTSVKCRVLDQYGDVPCPRWRHTATPVTFQGNDLACLQCLNYIICTTYSVKILIHLTFYIMYISDSL